MRMELKPNSRMQYDKNKALRSVFLPKESLTTDLKPMAMLNKDSSKDFAREILKNNSDKFGWSENLDDIVLDSVTETNNRLSSRFIQTFKGLPVGDSDIVVNFDSDSKLSSIYNNYHYNIPASLDPQTIVINKEKAISVVENISKMFTKRKIGEPLLIIYHHEIKENN